MELHELAESVSDEKSFLAFVDALRKDRELAAVAENASPSGTLDPGQHGWENITIESFLEAAQAWAEATEFGATQGWKETSPWKKFALFLYCGKVYE
jgi:hypothetical protein